MKPAQNGRWRLRGRALCTASIIPFLVLSASRGLAQPVGASVIAGEAQVLSSGATTVINQATNKAIINWQDFSVGAGASVQFNQPNAASLTLNRVTGANISNIEGAIRANGQVWLLNPNGVLFGNNARINVGGLLATTSDIANQDFVEGRYNFTSGRNSVVNNGSIQASSGGSVVLSAPKVVNNGLIQAQAGHVVLGGTDTFTVDFDGDRLLSYAVGANSAGGTVTNTGKISAPGGRILLTARAASGVQDAVINNTGMVEATSVREENGEIVLEAEDGGVVSSGTLDASGKGEGETGGTVKVLGKDVALEDGAVVDVSGDAGGGTALIGGNFHGEGSEQHAQTTTIAKASIKADAVTKGNGGKVAVWSDGRTDVSASITARGGAAGGDGGLVETSGHDLNITAGAFVSTLAPWGKSGTWLLDPDNIIIVSGGCTAIGGDCPNLQFGSSGTASVDPNAIVNALSAGNVLLQANQDITVADAVLASSSNTLEMEAGRSIILNNTLQNIGGSIGLYAGNPNATGGAQPGAAISGIGEVRASNIQLSLGGSTGPTSSIGTVDTPITINGTLSEDLNLSVQSNGADAFITTAASFAPNRVVIANVTTAQMPGIPNRQGVNLGAGNFNISSAAPIAQSWGITANNLNVTTTNGATVSLGDIGVPAAGDLGNKVSTATFNTDGSVAYGNAYAGTTSIGASTIGGDFTVMAAALTGPPGQPSTSVTFGALRLTGEVNTNGGTSLSAASISQSDKLATGDLSVITTTGAAVLDNSNNVINGTARFDTAGDASLTNSTGTSLGDSTVLGSLTVTTNDNSQTPGTNSNIAIDGNLVVAGDTSLHASGGITNFNSENSLTTTGLSLVSDNGDIGDDGAIRLNGYQGGPVVLKNIETGGSDAYLYSTSSVSVIGPGGGADAVNLRGGAFVLAALGDITVSAPIVTAFNRVRLDATGKIVVDADITAGDPDNGGGGAIWLTANDPILNDGIGNLDTNGISGIGTLTAANIILNVGEGPGGISGGIGTEAAPLHLDSYAGEAGLEVSLSVSAAGDVFLDSAVAVSFDLPFDQGAAPVSLDLTVGDPDVRTGNFTLTAAGPITQSYGIAVNDLTLNTTGGDGFIILDSSSCGCGDPGNQIEGIVRINTDQADAILVNERALNLGASSIQGQAQFIASDPNNQNAYIAIASDEVFRVQGHLSLFADTDIQGPGALETGDGLDAQAFNGSINLVNPMNAVSGGVVLASSEDDAINFANSVDTTILQLGGINSDGNPVPADSIEIRVADSSGLTRPNLTVQGTVEARGSITLAADGDLILDTGANVAGGDGDITLAAGGNFVNNTRGAVVNFTGAGRFLIYSAAPAGDVFGDLDSANTAIWGTTYPTPVTALGNRYIFAMPATLTLTAGDLSKPVGQDITATLQNDYTVTGLQPGVAGAFLADADAIFSGSPLLASAGAGASAAENIYAINISAGSFAATNGYALAFVNGVLTVGSGVPPRPPSPPTPPINAARYAAGHAVRHPAGYAARYRGPG